MADRRKKRQITKTKVSVVNIPCRGTSCKKPSLFDVFNPIPLKPRNALRPHLNYNHCHSSSSSATPSTGTTNTEDQSSFSTATSSPISSSSSTVRRLGRAVGDGVAVEKDSDDPYLDFRQSMLHMILENEIYSKDDLRELLSRFLRLNAPFHHSVILHAFTYIWDGVFRYSAAAAAAKRAGARPVYDTCVSRGLF